MYVVLQDMQCITVFWSLDEHGAKDVADHLSCIPHLDWTQPVFLLGFPNILMPSVSYVTRLNSYGKNLCMIIDTKMITMFD